MISTQSRRLNFKKAAAFSIVGTTLLFAQTAVADTSFVKAQWAQKKPKALSEPAAGSVTVPTTSAPRAGAGPIFLTFEALSQYDTSSWSRGFIPPDTMGAVGKTQYMQIINGGVAVFDKASGARLSAGNDDTWWNQWGGGGTNGDPRVLYNAQADRWIAIAFGADTKDISIAVSDTSDALGGWKKTQYEGYAGFGFGAYADYPTLAMDTNAVYIGTNNFASDTAGGAVQFRGTTLSVLKLTDLFNATGPTAAGIQKFDTAYVAGDLNNKDRGYAIQGVNSSTASTNGMAMSVSAFYTDDLIYDINNAGSGTATLGANKYLGLTIEGSAAARQPSGLRNIDTLDERISANVWEAGGRIYSVQTVKNGDYAAVRYVVTDAASKTVLDTGLISDGAHDYYQGSLAVNELGQVVISYNRSGYGADGRIKIMAQMFTTDANGKLVLNGQELLIRDSLTDRYLNGNTEASGLPGGRQRWGDYSAVNLDPTDSSKFWVIGQFAREANTAANGHPGGSGYSRWGTQVAGIQFTLAPVPEPATWAQMILGFGLIGGAIRRRSRKMQLKIGYAA